MSPTRSAAAIWSRWRGHSDAALSFEATIGDTATVGRRGASSWTIEVDADTGHSGRIFREDYGNGAIFEASRILDRFYESLRGERYLTFNPSVIVGGTASEVRRLHGQRDGQVERHSGEGLRHGRPALHQRETGRDGARRR